MIFNVSSHHTIATAVRGKLELQAAGCNLQLLGCIVSGAADHIVEAEHTVTAAIHVCVLLLLLLLLLLLVVVVVVTI